MCNYNIVEIKSSGSYFMTSIKGRNFRHNGRARYLLLIHKYYCKYVFLHTYLSYYILSISFDSLLPQINVRKDMLTALFCAVCTLPVFIMSVKDQFTQSIVFTLAEVRNIVCNLSAI